MSFKLFVMLQTQIASLVSHSSRVVPPFYFAFADFIRSLEDLKGEELLQLMQTFLSKDVAACQKGFERIANDAKASLADKKLLEEENRKLRDENERLKNQSHQLSEQVKTLTDQRTKQQIAIDALKKELEKSLECYEECRTELKDMVTQYDAQHVQIKANNNLIAELKWLKGELKDTLEKNETYCHQWGRIWRLPIVEPWRALGPRLRCSKLQTTSRASSSGYIASLNSWRTR
jgi:polyhydroxyalkanoate synthesis regulator protein